MAASKSSLPPSLALKFIPLPHCPACAAAGQRRLYDIGSSSVVRCEACGLKFLNPCLAPEVMSAVYESDETLQQVHDYHAGYYDYADLTSPSRTLDEFGKALDFLERRLSAGGGRSVFDVGFGTGLFLALAKKRGWAVDGVDTSAHNVSAAQKRFGLRLRHGEFERVSPLDGGFDVISFWDVLEHFPDPSPPLRHAGKLLKPGGVLLIGIPNDDSLMAHLAGALHKASGGRLKPGIRDLYFPEHVAYYTLASLSTLLGRNGWQPVHHFYSSTDLRKYRLAFPKNLIAAGLLALGRWTGKQNRLVAFYGRSESPV